MLLNHCNQNFIENFLHEIRDSPVIGDHETWFKNSKLCSVLHELQLHSGINGTCVWWQHAREYVRDIV